MQSVSQNVSDFVKRFFGLGTALMGCWTVFKGEFKQVLKKSAVPTRTFFAHMTSVTASLLLLFLCVLWLTVRL